MNKFTKIISVMLAVILVIMAVPFTTFAAYAVGDVNGDGKVAATDARLVLQIVAGIKKEADVKNAEGADVDGDGKIAATDARRILQIVAGVTPSDPVEPDAPAKDEYKANLAALFNAESAKAAKGTYKWERECEFTKDIDVGNATATLNNVIKAIDANADLNSVVGGFLGVGNASGTQADAGKYAIIPMNLTEDDIKSYQIDTEQITLFLNDSKNPSKDGNTAFNHVSNDFVTEADVKNAISEVTTAISVNSCFFNYYDVKVNARIENGTSVSLRISYNLYALMGFKVASMNINGNGEVKTVIEYTDLNY